MKFSSCTYSWDTIERLVIAPPFPDISPGTEEYLQKPFKSQLFQCMGLDVLWRTHFMLVFLIIFMNDYTSFCK